MLREDKNEERRDRKERACILPETDSVRELKVARTSSAKNDGE